MNLSYRLAKQKFLLQAEQAIRAYYSGSSHQHNSGHAKGYLEGLLHAGMVCRFVTQSEVENMLASAKQNYSPAGQPAPETEQTNWDKVYDEPAYIRLKRSVNLNNPAG